MHYIKHLGSSYPPNRLSRVSVVMGDVIDIGESAWRFAAAGPISRLRE